MVDISLDIKDVMAKLTNIEKRQVPWAQVVALNEVAAQVSVALRDRLSVDFDRPTRFTQNAFTVFPRATKSKPEAVVGEKPMLERRHYLKVQTSGGARGQTGFEKRLAPFLSGRGPVRSIVPAAGGPFEAAKLDAFGNWSKGERNKVMSALGAQRDSAANTTDASKRRAKGRATYFVPKHGLAPGVYRRDKPGAIPVRVLKVSDKVPVYKPNFKFTETSTLAYQRLIGPAFERALADAIRTSK